MLLLEHKKANMFKAKRLIEKGGTLITASTFPHSSKNSSAERIHTLPTCLILINTLTHIDKYTHTHTDSFTHTHIDRYKKREYIRLRNFWSCMER